MLVSDPSDKLAIIRRLRSELKVLSDLHAQASKDAVFLGMTPEQANEFDERRKEIAHLTGQILFLEEQ